VRPACPSRIESARILAIESPALILSPYSYTELHSGREKAMTGENKERIQDLKKRLATLGDFL